MVSLFPDSALYGYDSARNIPLHFGILAYRLKRGHTITIIKTQIKDTSVLNGSKGKFRIVLVQGINQQCHEVADLSMVGKCCRSFVRYDGIVQLISLKIERKRIGKHSVTFLYINRPENLVLFIPD